MTRIFRNGELIHGGDRKTFEVTTSTQSLSSFFVSTDPLSREPRQETQSLWYGIN